MGQKLTQTTFDLQSSNYKATAHRYIAYRSNIVNAMKDKNFCQLSTKRHMQT